MSAVGRMDVSRLLAELASIRERHPDSVVSPDLTEDEARRYYADGTWLLSRCAATCASLWLDIYRAPSPERTRDATCYRL